MKIKKIILSLLAVCAMISCENDESVSNVDATTNTAVKDSPVVQKLIELGYKREDIEETRDFYLVQGDMMFSKDINNYNKNITSRHASSDNLVSTQYRVVTVAIDESVSQSGVDDWSSAIQGAMNNWSNLTGTSIKFVRVSESADIRITSDYGLLPNNVIAAADFPYANGKAYYFLTINLDYNNNQTISQSTKIYNMVHELGHCIGFRHTNWDALNEPVNRSNGTGPGANYIPNTPNQDPNSVMNGQTANYTWNGFSQYDIIAVNYLYPPLACNTRLIGPSENRCAYNLYGDIANYTVFVAGIKQLNEDDLNPTWQVSGNSLEIIAANNSMCKIRVKGNNTTWPATGVVSRTSNTGCVSSYNVSLNNCNDPYITD